MKGIAVIGIALLLAGCGAGTGPANDADIEKAADTLENSANADVNRAIADIDREAASASESDVTGNATNSTDGTEQ